MTGPRIGSLFSGYGGLDMGVQAALGGSTAWFVEYDKAPSKILAHHWPDVPNYGDITTVDWSQVEPVDILTGGSPCQDLSHAGKRQGMTEGTRSNLWVAMREAIAQLRPSLVVWENVRGAASAPATSEVEFCPGCMGEGRLDSRPVLRALGRVVGDLSELGYVGRVGGLRAADVGAPHGRFRFFLAAWRPEAAHHCNVCVECHERGFPIADMHREGRRRLGWLEPVGRDADRRRDPHGLRPTREPASLLPTPRTSDTNGAGQHGEGGLDIRTAVTLLPTPAVNDMGEGKTVEAWDEWTAKMQAAHGNGNGHGKSLAIEAQRLLPTPEAADGSGGRVSSEYGGTRDSGAKRAITLATALAHQDWGIYADAIARWESLTRPAPAPTQNSESYLRMRARRQAGLDKRPVGHRGSLRPTPQLSPAFSEWLMGLPAGHVTDVPGLSRNDQLKALGNGVVPQQAAAALRHLLSYQEAS